MKRTIKEQPARADKLKKGIQPRVKPKNNGSGVEILDIADLTPDDKNARAHTPRGLGMLVDAIHEVGAARSGVIDEKGNILAGNMSAEAMAQAGIRRVKVVDANGDEWVVVRRTGLNAKQKKRLALYDNRTSEMSDWSLDVLSEFKTDDLLQGMWTDKEEELLFSAFQVNGVDAPFLQSGDRLHFQQMTFTVHDEQVQKIKDALGKAKDAGGGVSALNENNSNGNALTWICEAFNRG